jgi:hypothetical protein
MRTRSDPALPADWVRIRQERWGPFVTRELVRRPDGDLVELSARRHRKRRVSGGVHASADDTSPSAHAVVWAPRDIGWWIGVLFIAGAACFTAGSIPLLSSAVSVKIISTIYFVGSLFFTGAGYLQYSEAINSGGRRGDRGRRWFGATPSDLGWWATAVQLAGTLFFNVTTFESLRTGFTVHQENLRVWSPDFFGSICFLVASWLAVKEVRAPGGPRWRWREVSWRIVWINLLGSVFFMASAIAAFVRPATDELLAAGVANGGTFLGAVCFLWGAWLLLVELADTGPLPITPREPDRAPRTRVALPKAIGLRRRGPPRPRR